jgi:uncharacterized protein (DUF1501 family)
MNVFSRRSLLQGLSAFGLSRLALGRALAQAPASGRVLVTLFLRGGVDGLSMVPPLADPHYAALRPGLQLRAPGSGGPDAALRLDDTFGLHPALAPLLPLFQAKQLAVVHAVGQASPSRSHFDAQDFLESGTPGRRSATGYLSRALATLPPSSAVFRAVALQTSLPVSLQGDPDALAFSSLAGLKVQGAPAGRGGFEALYASAVDAALRNSAEDAFAGIADAQRFAQQSPRYGAGYPKGALGQRLADVARLIHADAGLQVAATELGGFDTHLQEGVGQGALATRLTELGQALAAFAQDLGPELSRVCVLTVTEFGRTARENGTRGTDHGTASAMFVMGGGVQGGRVHGAWPSLAPGALYEGRDLRVTTDVRAVLSAALERTLSVRGTSVFPDFSGTPTPLFG